MDFSQALELVRKELTAGDVHIDTAMGNGGSRKGRLGRLRRERMAKSAANNTLYVRRNLTNESAEEFTTWAKSQGFTNLTPNKDLHATIVYSKGAKPNLPDSFDNVQAADTEGREVEPLGDKGAVVLRFRSGDLEKRWKEARDLGATWDYPTGYKPHVTITYDGGNVDLSKVTPFMGVLKFGPEIHEPINENWAEDKGYRVAKAQIAKAAPTGKTVWAWASVIEENGKPVIDHQGDVISEAELEKAFDGFMENSRDVGLMHNSVGHGRVTQGLVFTKELQQALGIDLGRCGALVKINVDDPEVQKRVASGELRELSIGGTGKRKKI